MRKDRMQKRMTNNEALERSCTTTSITAVDNTKDSHEPRRRVPNMAHPWLNDCYYIVVGFMGDGIATRKSVSTQCSTDPQELKAP